jgi:hypothetical protein
VQYKFPCVVSFRDLYGSPSGLSFFAQLIGFIPTIKLFSTTIKLIMTQTSLSREFFS